MKKKLDNAKVMEIAKKVGPGYSVVDAARDAGSGKGTITRARIVMAKGTPQEIARCRSGEYSLERMASLLGKNGKGLDPAQREAAMATVLTSHRDRRREDAIMYSTLRDALLGITSLPHPRDVLAAVRHMKRRNGHDVERSLPLAIKWLKEFANEYGRAKAA